MARTRNNQRAAGRTAVDVGVTGTRPASKGAVIILVVSVLAASWAVAMMTTPGRVGYLYFFMYAEYYLGVITLVSLSITIMVGLVATDRLVLSIRQRVLLQSTHRTTGMIAVTSLVGHVWTKYAEQHIQLVDVFVPFLYEGSTRTYVGMGTLSGWIMMLVMWSGIARSRFIGRGQPWMWRSIHAVSYLMWPIALLHGLNAGRPAKPWVVVSYLVCILLVLVGLAVRLTVSLNRRKDFSSTAGGALKPVGMMVPTATPIAKRPARREPERVGPVAVTETFRPVSAPPQAEPQYVEVRYAADAPRAGRRRAEPDYNNAPVARGRRHAAAPDELPRQRRHRYEDNDQIRYGRSGFVDLGDIPPDDTPTLVDMASRRARREQQQEVARVPAGSRSRRATRGRAADDVADEGYWAQLRGEAN